MTDKEPQTVRRLRQRLAAAHESRRLIREGQRVLAEGGGLPELLALGMGQPSAEALLRPDGLAHGSMMVTISAGYVGRLEAQLDAALRAHHEREARRGNR